MTYANGDEVFQKKSEKVESAESKAGEVSRDKHIWEAVGPASHHEWEAKRRL